MVLVWNCIFIISRMASSSSISQVDIDGKLIRFNSKITESDLPKIKELHGFLLPLSYNDEWYASLLTQDMITIVAVDETNRFVGIVTGKVEKNGNDLFNWLFNAQQNKEAYITTIGVLEEFRKKGLAKILLQKASDYFMERWACGIVTLQSKQTTNPQLHFICGMALQKRENCLIFIGLRNDGAMLI